MSELRCPSIAISESAHKFIELFLGLMGLRLDHGSRL
jgi:hypothetical protein